MHKLINFKVLGLFLILMAVAITVAIIYILINVARELELVEALGSFTWNLTELGSLNDGMLSVAPGGLFLLGLLVGSFVLGAVSSLIKSLTESGISLMTYVEKTPEQEETHGF